MASPKMRRPANTNPPKIASGLFFSAELIVVDSAATFRKAFVPSDELEAKDS